jgi:hypothetical protein
MGSKVRIVVTALVLVVISALAINARPWLGERLLAKSSSRTNMTAIQPVVQSGMVSTTLKSVGFEPASTTIGGAFTLSISNQSGVDGLNFVVKRDSGEQVREINVPAGTLSWSGVIDLPAGGYTMMEVNHPAWLYHITIQ